MANKITRVAADIQAGKARSMAVSKGFKITRSADGMPYFTRRDADIIPRGAEWVFTSYTLDAHRDRGLVVQTKKHFDLFVLFRSII
ncbi:TPA: hypothetical protein ACGCAJ_004728 [Serratia marcescens]